MTTTKNYGGSSLNDNSSSHIGGSGAYRHYWECVTNHDLTTNYKELNIYRLLKFNYILIVSLTLYTQIYSQIILLTIINVLFFELFKWRKYCTNTIDKVTRSIKIFILFVFLLFSIIIWHWKDYMFCKINRKQSKIVLILKRWTLILFILHIFNF